MCVCVRAAVIMIMATSPSLTSKVALERDDLAFLEDEKGDAGKWGAHVPAHQTGLHPSLRLGLFK